jgi:hypothetical protein
MPEPVEEPPKGESLADVKHGERTGLDAIPPDEPETILGQALKDQVGLKRRYGKWLLIMIGAQLLVADGTFVAIAWAGYDWHVRDSVMHVWLAATLVQIVGVVTIVVRSLFGGADIDAALEIAKRGAAEK